LEGKEHVDHFDQKNKKQTNKTDLKLVNSEDLKFLFLVLEITRFRPKTTLNH